MPKSSLSAFSSKITICLLALILSSCGDDDITLPKIYGVEVPSEVLNEPRPVPTAPLSVNPKDWPLLGKVPTQPKDFTPPETVGAAKDEMENDSADAVRLRDDYEQSPPVTSSMTSH
jgi:hypothetical protein